MPVRSNQVPDLVVVYRPRTSLKPYANNARVHSRRQLRKIVASLQEFGWTNPIIIDENLNVLCGHGRLLAAAELGIEAVPTITLSHLSDTQRRAYILADNAIATKAGWSKSLLKGELQGLADIGYDVELTGFDTLEIDTMLSLDDDSDASEEELVELPGDEAPLTQLGDHWLIGDHHLLCADARDVASYEELLAGDLAELVFTDPPYNVRIAGHVSGLGKVQHREFVMGSGELSDAEFSMQFLRPALRSVARSCQAGAIAFVCMDWRGAPRLLDAAEGVFPELKNLIVFVKSNAGMGTFYRSQHELIYAFKASPGPTINNFGLGEGGRHRSNVWTYAGAVSYTHLTLPTICSV